MLSLKDIMCKGFYYTLYPYQKRGVALLDKHINKNGGALLSDDMGLGKTAQVLAWLNHSGNIKKTVIIVVPSHLKETWRMELFKTTKRKGFVLEGQTPYKLEKNKIYIINYEIFSFWFMELERLKAKVLIWDECHYVSNEKAQRTGILKLLAEKIPCKIALSGTPFKNSPMELFTTLNIICPKMFYNKYSFGHTYCYAEKNKFGLTFKGAKNSKKLHKILKTNLMIRRKKEKVLKELPLKTRIIVSVPLKNRKRYEKAESDFINWLREEEGTLAASRAKKALSLVKITKLKKLIIEEKMEAIINWVSDFLHNTDKKLVIFAENTFALDALHKKFSKTSIVYDGKTKKENKKQAPTIFEQNKNIRLFLGNLRSCSTGLTLTKASDTLTIQLGWNSVIHDQAEDRVHRIGQKEKVFSYYCVGTNTIETKLLKLIEQKRNDTSKIMDGKKVKEKENLLNLFLKEMLKDV